jgi:hypothetical protein
MIDDVASESSAGKYDEHLARSRQMLADAETEYQDALVKSADATSAVRGFILGEIQGRIDEARHMVETFSSED